MKSLFERPSSSRPTGSAPFPQPAPRDREALFWWLKRNTSYTAWKDNARLWADFTNEFEAWLRKQDDPSAGDVQTLKYALDTQLAYERGLQRLRIGDRSVFDVHSSEGWLARLSQSLIARRLEWVGPADVMARLGGFPVSTVVANYVADDAAAAVDHFSLYEKMGFPEGAARRLLDALPFDATLPEPRWEVVFAPGKRAPMDGIYEMIDAAGHIVGTMRYCIRGEATPDDEDLEFGPQAGERSDLFVWRLLWEDVRYKDGRIPDEESVYLLPGDAASTIAPAALEKLRCDSSQPCPRSGWWSTPAGAGARRHFERGDSMPALAGDYGRTIWQWDANQAA